MFVTVLGAIVAILVAILIEHLRQPRLKLEIASPTEADFVGRPARHMCSLTLALQNRPPSLLFRWVSRNAALQCHGTVDFYRQDGHVVFNRSMLIRWHRSREPVSITFEYDNKRGQVFDPNILNFLERRDIYPGEQEPLDIAVKFDNEDECYGWSNENYFSSPHWKDPNWKLPRGLYHIRVTIVSSGKKCIDNFILINDAPARGFRIDKYLPTNKFSEWLCVAYRYKRI